MIFKNGEGAGIFLYMFFFSPGHCARISLSVKPRQVRRRSNALPGKLKPTSSSWLNLVERWFGEITRKRIRRGVFRSVPELITAIEEYIRANNENPKPFVWTKRAEEIIKKIAHCKAVIETLH